MDTLGIIPMAGKGSRWGGSLKELLPMGSGAWLVDNTISAMGMVTDNILIISSPEKIHTHVQHFQKFKYLGFNITYVIQKGKDDMWGAISSALPFTTDLNLFAMPDTLYDPYCFSDILKEDDKKDFYLGTFQTELSQRFGILYGGTIVNKQDIPGTWDAWGSFIFSKKIAELWTFHSNDDYGASRIDDYTKALNYALINFGATRYPMNYYTDFASFEDYKNWIQSQPS